MLTLTAGTVPLVFDTSLFSQFYLTQALVLETLVSAAVASALLWIGSKGTGPWRRTSVDGILLLFVGWILARTVWSISPAISWNGEYGNMDGARIQLAYVALFFVTAQAVRTEAERATLALAFGLAGLVASTYVLLQAAGLDFVRAEVSFASLGRFDGTAGNPIPAGAVAAVSLVLLIALLSTREPHALRRRTVATALAVLGGSAYWLLRFAVAVEGPHRGEAPAGAFASPASWFLLFGVLCSLGQLLLAIGGHTAIARPVAMLGLVVVQFRALAETGSRSAWIGLGAGAAAAIALGVAGASERVSSPSLASARRRLLPLVVGVGALAILFAVFALGTASGERLLASALHPGEALARSRANIWQPAIAMWRDRPFGGWGVDTFMRVFPAYETATRPMDLGEQAVPQNAHSEPLMVLATLGAVGLLAWLVLFVTWFWAAARWQRADARSAAWRLQLGGIAAIAVIAAYGLLGIPSIPLRMALWMLIALTLPARPAGASSPWRVPRGLRTLLAAVLLSAALSAAYFGYTADRAYREAFVAWRTVDRLPGAPPGTAFRLGSDALHGIPAELADPPLAAMARDLRASEAAVERLVQRGQADPQQAVTVAGRFASLALFVRAAVAQERAVAARPREPQYHWFLGEVLARRYELFPEDEGKGAWFERARTAYEDALDIARRDAFATASLARLHFQRWRLEKDVQALLEARRQYQLTLEMAPMVQPFLRDAMSLECSAGQPDAALRIVDEASRRAPAVAAVVLAGHPLFESLCGGDLATGCREVASRALEGDPRSPAARAILERLGP